MTLILGAFDYAPISDQADAPFSVDDAMPVCEYNGCTSVAVEDDYEFGFGCKAHLDESWAQMYAAEAYAESAVERYYEGAWDVTGAYDYEGI